jgi:putative transposase
MIDPQAEVSVRRQCKLLDICRSGVYYQPVEPSAEELQIMRLIDEIHLDLPFYGSRKIRVELERRGHCVNRKRIQRLMQIMGLEALYPRKKTTRPNPEHKIYPYLLRNVTIDHVNHVWSTDITYIPMAKGFVYLVAVIDWYSRKVLSWRLSNTMDTHFCVEALQEALTRYGPPEIFNTDQGSQFTSDDFTKVLKEAGVAISMDGKGRWVDNVFIERLWRSVKYEEVYLKAYENPTEAKRSLDKYFDLYNTQRPHQALNDETPDAVYFAGLNLNIAA